VQRPARRSDADVARRVRREQVQSVGKALRRGAADSGAGRTAVAIGRWRRRVVASLVLLLLGVRAARAQDDAPERLDVGRITAVYFPQDERLARSLVTGAARTDSFPWLPRPRERVLIAIAPDARRFRQW